MKKIIFLVGCLLLVSACSNIKDLKYEDIINNFATTANRANTYRQGYKYYLPRNLAVSDSTLFNEVLTNEQETFYLYVDGVSYSKKIKKDYQVSNQSYFSKAINYQDKFGYVEINKQENEKYLVEIMYNYAKIEVMVDKDRINEALFTSVSILKSIEYKEEIIANLFGKDVLNFKEEEFNIFNTTSSDSTYLQIDDTYDVVEDEELPDTDLIN